ncbi:MAG: MerC domain-containing protein [Chakrabartia sp.]
MSRDLILISARDRFDRLAIGLSGLCVAHCVASSLILAFMASAGGVLLHPLIHEVGLALAIFLGALGLGRGWRAHGARLPAGIGALGLGLMAFALTRPHDGSEAAFTILGASLLAMGHFLNRRALA